MKIFDVEGIPGDKVFSYIDMFEYPHGTKEQLPIAIIQGEKSGPILLLTGNIHGDELHGLVTVQEVIQEINPKELYGTVIAIPTLNPAGLLTMTRSPFYDRSDPNRLWPDPKPKKDPKLIYEDPYDKNLDPKENPSVQEVFYTKFAEILTNVDYFVDLHCHSFRSLPYSYIDRIYYDEKKEGEKEKAQILFDKTLEMVEAFGFTIVLEDPPKHYFRKDLHRSTTGSFVNLHRKPGFTVELGASEIVDTKITNAAKIGVFNILKWSKMLEGEIESITSFSVHSNELWREIEIRVSQSGLYIPLVTTGELVNQNDPIAVVHDIFGEVKETISAPEDGTVLAFFDDIRCYPNKSIGSFLVKNTVGLILPWEYEKEEEEKETKET
ncbi:MAG: succinylglutamate desuccinylase/aspartoacylase family protein [Candidatus Heimdallarchaeaceae archaeon]|jgi:predicted deacylase